MTNATNAQYAFNATTTHSTYANGTLTINPGTSVFSANEYALTYAYQPSLNTGSAGSSSIFTTTARVTANNQAISFTGLSAQPKAFAIIPRGNITLSTSNRFVVNVNYDGTTMSGVYCYGSGSAYNASYTAGYSAAYFTQTYNNGTLTITTSSTTNGGYFAANVDYALIAIC